jgi:hypothetical protein
MPSFSAEGTGEARLDVREPDIVRYSQVIVAAEPDANCRTGRSSLMSYH